MDTEHKQVAVDCFGTTVEVDEGLADLLQEIWKAGIDTELSCQENQPGVAWIEFSGTTDAEFFLEIISEHCGAELYDKITQCNPIEAWDYAAHPNDLSMERTVNGDKRLLAKPAFCFSISVRFPVIDIPLVLAILRKYNEKMGVAQ